jgi:CubicO group peptidase (beta-lactamase class C family)
MRLSFIGALALGLLLASACATARPGPTPASIDAEAARAMAATGAKGLAIAVVEDGRVTHVGAYGVRNLKGEPLTTDTVMYGASLTKATFGYMVMQLVEEGKLGLDTPIERLLPKPLPSYDEPGMEDRYAPWRDLAGDERWRKITPRMLLTHSGGFGNFHWDEPDEKLRIHFEPGSRYAYSGNGMILLQFVLERGLGLDVGAEMQRRVFDRYGMTRTSMIWRPDFAANLADGWDETGGTEPHDQRSKVRAAGSMDTTIADMAKLAAGYARGEGLSAKGRADLVRGGLPITTAGQFPSLRPEAPAGERVPGLAAGLGVVAFTGPQGPGWFKGGHNDTTGNTWVCIERGRRCVVILSNDVRAEQAFPGLVRFVLGETGAPWTWEYGPKAAGW